MTIDERAEGTAEILLNILANYEGTQVKELVAHSLKIAFDAVVDETHQDWSHALMTAVEEYFPLADREWREWPCAPDVDVVCNWLKQLIREVRANDAAIAGEIKKKELSRPSNEGLESCCSLTAAEIEECIRAQ